MLFKIFTKIWLLSRQAGADDPDLHVEDRLAGMLFKYFNLVTVLALNLNQLPAIIYMLKYVFCDEDVVVPLYQWNSIRHPTSGLFSTAVINFELV